MTLYSRTVADAEPYVPGEQPKGIRIKLNQNESPYPPCPGVKAVLETINYEDFRLYPDTGAYELRAAIAETLGVSHDMIFAGGGSDEILSFAFMAFFNGGDRVYYPDITYGYYRVLAKLFGLEPREIPLDAGFRINVDDYLNADGHIVFANPNAPTGIALTAGEIEPLLAANPDRLFISDEAYVHFSDGKGCESLLNKYKNLLIVRTYSKSYAMAGMRIGYALGDPKLINILDRVKDSFNPYNFDRVSLAAGIAAVRGTDYLRDISERTAKTRNETREALRRQDFEVFPSETNFLFIRKRGIGGDFLYRQLNSAGILVRHFNKPRISEFIRVSMGTPEEMGEFVKAIGGIAR